jgi:hypothetical protein
MKVVQAQALECEPGKSTSLPLPSGTLANVVTGLSGCGSDDHPWLIEVATTQRIIMTLTDLTSRDVEGNSGPGCELYATVKEVSTGSEFRICQGYFDEYLSVGNKLELSLKPPALTGDKYFLLHYEVTGCPEPSYPTEMWIRRGSDHVTIGCYSSRLSWRLECYNNTWHGEVGNCTTLPKPVGGHYIPEIATPVPATDQRDLPSYTFDPEIGVLVAVAGGVFLCILLLAVGLLFDKSKEKDGQSAPGQVLTTPIYGTNTSSRKPAYNTTTSRNHSTVSRLPHTSTPVPNGNPANQNAGRLPVRDSIADRSSIATGYYDVPHYYELDPDYEDGRQNVFVSNGEKNALIDL